MFNLLKKSITVIIASAVLAGVAYLPVSAFLDYQEHHKVLAEEAMLELLQIPFDLKLSTQAEKTNRNLHNRRYSPLRKIYGWKARDVSGYFINHVEELPLYRQDYYWGKFENAKAGVDGLNDIPVLKPGDSVGVVKDKYINIESWKGYIQAAHGYYFGSGVCWSTSALGLMMDGANERFRDSYGIDLFVYDSWDRAPHGTWYSTYGGYGYTILQISEGNPLQDYRFRINPKISQIEDLEDFELKIIMLSSREHPEAYNGESIAAMLISNRDF
ncbi:MAG: hypothetical protein ACE5DX_04965 [Candidatus Dojkabacteria bacterium]